MVVGCDGVRNRSTHEHGIVGSEDFFGERWRRNDNCGYEAELKFHYGAVSTSEPGKRFVGKLSEFEEVTEERKRTRTGREIGGSPLDSRRNERESLDQAPQ